MNVVRQLRQLVKEPPPHMVKAGEVCGVCLEWVFRGAALGGAVLSTLVLMLFVLLSHDGLSLNIMRPAFEAAVIKRTGAEDVNVGSVVLVRDAAADTPFRLEIQRIELSQQGGNTLNVPSVSIELAASSLLRGQAMPRFVEVNGAVLEVEREGNRVEFGGTDEAGAPLDIGALIDQVRAAGLEGAILRDFSLRYRNLASGAAFVADHSTASLTAEGDGYLLRMSVPYPEQGEDSMLALDAHSDTATKRVRITISALEAPASAVLPLFLGTNTDVGLDAEISGTITAEGGWSSGITDMGLALVLNGRTLTVGGRTFPLEFVTVDGIFDPLSRYLTVNRLNYEAGDSRGQLAGQLAFDVVNGTFERMAFDVTAKNVVIDDLDLLEADLPMDWAQVAGEYDVAGRSVAVNSVEAAYFGATIGGDIIVDLALEPGQSPGVHSDLRVTGALTPAEVLRGWPVAMGDGARRWISSNLLEAELYNVSYQMDLERGALSGGEPLPPEAVNLTFDVRDGNVIYVSSMTPITGLNASAHLRGNSFKLSAEGGHIGDVRVAKGAVEMAKFVPKGAPAMFSATLEGDVPTLLSLLDEEPLRFMTKSGISPSQFDGQASFNLQVVRPMLSFVPASDYRYTGQGKFWDLEMRDAFADLDLESASGTIKLSPRALTLAGEVGVYGVPAEFSLRRTFGGLGAMTLNAAMDVDAAAADLLGFPVRRFIDGTLKASLRVEGHSGSFKTGTVSGDLTDVMVGTTPSSALKRQGVDGDISFDFDLSGADEIKVDNFRWIMPDTDVQGRATLTKALQFVDVDLPQIKIGPYADMTLTFRRLPEELKVSVVGAYANFGLVMDSVIRHFGRSREDAPATAAGDVNARLPMAIDVDLKDVELKNDVHLTEVTGQGRHDGQQLSQLSLTGSFDGVGQFLATLAPATMTMGHEVNVETDALSQLLKGVVGINNVQAGYAEFSATALPHQGMVGSVHAEAVTLENAPGLARILSAGSIDGLNNLLNSDGINFDEVMGDLQIKDGKLTIVDARATGSALGVSANGEIDLAQGVVGLHGAVAPAYQVNSFFGDLPGLGALFVSRKGEGIFAFGYQVSGELAEPLFTVNTLSALAPGILRRIFEPVVGPSATTADLLQATEQAAAAAEALSSISTPELLEEFEEDQRQSETSRSGGGSR